jgi:hypothetical protein
MKPAQFEEKEYEAALYSELQSSKHAHWVPGQVLEQYLGFDYGLLLSYPYLWDLHGIPSPLGGISPFYDLWRVLRRPPPDRSRLPSFDLNCFVQAKRPWWSTYLSRKLARLGLVKPYFKFLTEKEQQECLGVVAQHLSDRALFVYAAPVFGSSKDLFRHTTAGIIVENSTFPKASVLSGHQAWYYSQPGATGVVNPEFEPVQQPPLSALIDELRRARRRERITESQSANLRSLADKLKATIREEPTIAETARAANLSQEWNRIEAFTRANDPPPAVTAFLEVDAFARFYNLRWLVIDDSVGQQ